MLRNENTLIVWLGLMSIQVKAKIKLKFYRGQVMKTIRLYHFLIKFMRNNKLHFSSKYKSFIVINGVDFQLTGTEISGGFVKK
jgi:hypothetical protein